ncbi:replication-relaxation family protein [Streptomyces adustus]|uniref:replication-relaxation family protein n=1 Tax=Streptomyces adustus TaxID=1609272 RepID=UPI00371B44F5
MTTTGTQHQPPTTTAITSGSGTAAGGCGCGCGASGAAGPVPGAPDPLSHQLLTTLAQHRIATLHQLHQLLRPHATRQAMSQPLNRLHRAGLADYTLLPRSGRTRAWYLTRDGARLARSQPGPRGHLSYPVTSATAASFKTPHTLTVLRAHVAFVCDARQRGDEHGPLDWTPETSHALGDGERITADALIHYTLASTQQRIKLRAFVEVDRATMGSERLAAKLIDYARLFTHQPQPPGRPRQTAAPGPAWLRWYPVFPRILFILTGAARPTLEHRISDLQAMTAQHPHVAALARQVPTGAAILEDLEHHGPGSTVWTPLTGGEPRSWTDL